MIRGARLAGAIGPCVACSTLVGCMPWIAPPATRVVPAGRVELGAGVAALISPAEPAEMVPVPQAWLRLGIASRFDAGLSVAAPLTAVADVRWQAPQRGNVLVSTGVGGGVHAFPDVGDLGEGIALPVGTAYIAVEHEQPARGYYGFARAWVPAYLESEPHAAVIWGQFGGGLEWRGRRLEHGPQLGFVVPSTGFGEGVLIAAWAIRWRRQAHVRGPQKPLRRMIFGRSDLGLTPPVFAGILPVSKRRGVEQSGSSPGS